MRTMTNSPESWMGIVPDDWNESKIKYAAPIHNERSENNIGYIGLEDIVSWKGVVEPSNSTASGESITFQKNDVMFGKLRPYLAKAFLAKNDGCGSTELLVMRPKDIVPKYLFYITLSKTFIDCIDLSTYGTKMPRANGAFIGNIHIPIPSKVEQEAIVKFLDKYCFLIDEAIDKHQKIIDALKQYVINKTIHTATQGICNKECYDSDCEWLGKIPKNWSVRRIGSIFAETNERGNDTLPILTVSINTGISDKEIDEEENTRKILRSEDKSKYKRMKPGDIVYNMMRAWQGAFGAARIEGMVSPAYVTARPIIEVDSRYFEYLFRTDRAAEEFKRHSRGITDFRLRLYWPEFKTVKVCVPPLEEQRAIADYLDNLYKSVEEAQKKYQETIEKLEEYRKSIIYHAVTGKIDCREVSE